MGPLFRCSLYGRVLSLVKQVALWKDKQIQWLVNEVLFYRIEFVRVSARKCRAPPTFLPAKGWPVSAEAVLSSRCGSRGKALSIDAPFLSKRLRDA